MTLSSPLSIDIGVITAWAGAIGNIPPGWFLCDGTNGTPDLSNKFLVSDGPNFSVDDTGGGFTHTHTYTGDGHHHHPAAGTEVAEALPGINDITDTQPGIGTTEISTNLPRYYGLAYIMFGG